MKSTTTTLGLLLLSYFPAIIATFTLSNPAWNDAADTFTGTLTADGDSDYGPSIDELTFTYELISGTTSRVQISDGTRYTIPESVTSTTTPALDALRKANPPSACSVSYSFSYTESPFTFTVTDKATTTTLFSSSPDFQYSNQYLKLTTTLPSTNKLFGLGESTTSPGGAIPPGTTHTMWARDMAAAAFDTNLYASHPFYLSLDKTTSFGGFLRNSNGMDTTYSSDATELTFEVNGGIIDLFVFAGPTPAAVTKQYMEIIGTPMMQPLWSLGFHQCRYGYTKLQDMIDVVHNMLASRIPIDIAWLDIDYMSRWLDFTYDETLFPAEEVKAFVEELHEGNMKYVPIIDPGILAVDESWDLDYTPYTEGMEMDVFVKDLTGETPYMGQVWPGPTHFPDWFHPNATTYWTNQLAAWHDLAPFDGVWVDMNEVSNFCTGQVCRNGDPANCPTLQVDTQTVCCLVCDDPEPENELDFPKFNIGNDVGINDDNHRDDLYMKTIPSSAVHYDNVKQYDVHNLHGTMEAKATAVAMEKIRDGKRSFVLSRSSFPGHGNHAAHWTGDNAATWNDLKASIVTVNNFAMFGLSMVGADICGFIGDSTEELCARWIEVGAFHPFSRNHNTFGAAPQEFYVWDSVATAARGALGMRYKMMQVLYTLMWKANVAGDTVARYMWINFPEDENTHAVDEQFMLGDGILVTPVVEEGAREVEGYFPRGLWYNLFSREMLDSEGEKITLSAELEEVNVHVLGGSILGLKTDGGMTTVDSAMSGYEIVVALGREGSSVGELYVDDNNSVDVGDNFLRVKMSAKDGSFVSDVEGGKYEGEENNLEVDSVVVLGGAKVPEGKTVSVSVGGKKGGEAPWSVGKAGELIVDLTGIEVGVGESFSLEY